ncbi:MAG: DUF554 domain-containing protein [Clostridia bacterium]|nr:DUF554 domain-containing protein [Clostridia bacterium]
MLGTVVNALAIVVGAILGKMMGQGLPENFRKTILQGLGLGVLLVGLTMAVDTREIMVVLFSLLLGAVIGEAVGVEGFLDRCGEALERAVSRDGMGGDVARGFVTASLIYCVGAMAIMGSLESGLTGNHDILFAKSLLDGVMSVVLASTLGLGVAFSAFSVFIYQGSITLLAQWISPFMNQGVISEMTSVGGLLIVGIALNVLNIKKIHVGNLLPSILVAFVLVIILQAVGYMA